MEAVSVYLCVFFIFIHEKTLLLRADTETCKDCGDEIPLEILLRLNEITDKEQLFQEFIKPSTHFRQVPLFGKAPPFRNVALFKQSSAVNELLGPDSVPGHQHRYWKSEPSVENPFEPDENYSSDEGSYPTDEEPFEHTYHHHHHHHHHRVTQRRSDTKCKPELRTICLQESQDPMIVYWPRCTRLEQCGGCHIHNRISCKPVANETVNFEVTELEYAGNGQFINKGKKVVSREKHTKCDYVCIPEVCNELEEYLESQCRCVCTNKEAEASCHSDPKKHWNSKNCSCECGKVEECSTGSYYDLTSCSCEPLTPESQSEDGFTTLSNESSDDFTTSRRPPLTHKQWQPNYSFNGGN